MKTGRLKKTLALILVIAMTAALSIGGTLAWLTATTESKNNLFTAGNIKIDLNEEVGVNGGKDKVTEDETGAHYTHIVPGDTLNKKVTITNTGDNPAYVRAVVLMNNAVAINNAIDQTYEDAGKSAEEIQAIYNEVFDGWGINYNPRPGTYGNDARGVIDGTYDLPEHVLHVDFTKALNGYWMLGKGNWFIDGSEKAGQYWVDATRPYDGYYVQHMDEGEILYAYYIYLPAGESTTLFNGLKVPGEFDAEQLAMFEDLSIQVFADAIQAENTTDGETDVDKAAQAAFTKLEEQHSLEELLGENKATMVSTADELKAALAEGGKVVLTNDLDAAGIAITGTVDLNGNTLSNADTLSGNVTLKNGTVTGNGSYVLTVSGGDNVTLSNVNVVGSGENNGINVYGRDAGTLNISNSKITNVATGISTYKIGADSTNGIGTLKNVTIEAGSVALDLGYAKADLIENCTFTAPTALQLHTGWEGNYGAKATVKDSALNGNVTLGTRWYTGTDANIELTIDNCTVTGTIHANTGDGGQNNVVIVTAATGTLDQTEKWDGVDYTYTPAV